MNDDRRHELINTVQEALRQMMPAHEGYAALDELERALVASLGAVKKAAARDFQGCGDMSPSDALRSALEAYDNETGHRIYAAGQVVKAARALCSQPSPWNYDMEQAPEGEKLWLAIDEMEGRESLIGHCFRWDDGDIFETYTGLKLKPYAWMLYEAPAPPAAPLPEQVEAPQ